MPPIVKKAELPETLRTYAFHGVDFNYRQGAAEATADCPFCGRANKFSVKVESGQWRCLVCGEGPEKDKSIRGGNHVIFLRTLYRLSKEATKSEEFVQLAKNRGLLSTDTLKAWGIVKSITTGEWLVPGHNSEKALCQLYRYVRLNTDKGPKFKLLATPPSPTLQHQLHGIDVWGDSKQIVFLCEGPWDGMALWEVLRQTKSSESGLAPTGNPKLSFIHQANVIAVPGCTTFKPIWCKLFAGKRVIVLFDNDHPKKNEKTGQPIPPASIEGLKRTVEILQSSPTPPEVIQYLCWGDQNYDANLKSGTDLRDVFNDAGTTLGPRIKALGGLMGKFSNLPEEWVKEAAGASKRTASKVSSTIPCSSYKEVINAWRKAMKWTEGLDYSFATMLASVVSVRLVGDQLWVKIVGPASCGKTSLAKALGMAKDHVVCEDVIRGFTSGWRGEGKGSAGPEDEEGGGYDLASRVRNKTLITMDGDTLMQSPNLGNILGEARRLYDGTLSSHFKNGMGKAVDQHRFTWIICGTSSLRGMDSSELGERFLDCVLMEGIDDDFEDEVLTRVANKVIRNMATEVSNAVNSQEDPDMDYVMRLTGGYIEWLKANASSEMSKVLVSDEQSHYCTRLGKFVAFMRARPSTVQDETADREFAARLVTQHLRLASCLAVVMNKTTFDEDILKRVQKVALDTARGKTMEIARHLFEAEELGLEVKSIAMFTSSGEAEVRKLLRFLKKIGVTEFITRKIAKGMAAKPVWTLTAKMRKLWKQVHNIQ